MKKKLAIILGSLLIICLATVGGIIILSQPDTSTEHPSQSDTQSPVVSTHPHKVTLHNAIPATCTEKGERECWFCETCNMYFADIDATIELTDIAVAPLGHTYIAEYVPATCTTDGYTKQHCTVCDNEYIEIHMSIGHILGQWETMTEAGCTTEGQEAVVCMACSHTLTRSIPAHNHNYAEKEQVEENGVSLVAVECVDCGYQRTVLENSNTQHWGEPVRKFGVPEDFSFHIISTAEESSIRQKLRIVPIDNQTGALMPYALEMLDNHVWKVSPVNAYQKGITYVATTADGVYFESYDSDSLHFRTIEDETSDVVYRTGVRFLDELERQSPGYYPYELQTNDMAQYTYLTVGKIDGLNVGDTLYVGDRKSFDSSIRSTGNDVFVGKIVNFLTAKDGRWLVVMEKPLMNDLFESFDIYQNIIVDFSGIESDSPMLDDAETLLLTNDEYHQFLAQIKLASDAYLQERGLVSSTKNVESFLKKIKFEKEFTSEDLYKEDGSEGKDNIKETLILGLTGTLNIPAELSDGTKVGQLTITIQPKITITVNAHVDTDYEAKNGESMDECTVIVKLTTKFNFTFSVSFQGDYKKIENPLYKYNTQSKVIHDASCSSLANVKDWKHYTDVKDPASLMDFYFAPSHSEYRECHQCQPITRMQNDYFLTTPNMKYHTSSCTHLKGSAYEIHEIRTATNTDIESSTPVKDLQEKLSAQGYVACGFCHPNLQNDKDFSEYMMASMLHSDWGQTVSSIASIMKENVASSGSGGEGDSFTEIGSEKGVKIPIIPAILDLKIELKMIMAFDCSASIKYEYEIVGTHEFGVTLENGKIHMIKPEPKDDEPKDNDLTNELTMIGEVGVKVGTRLDLALQFFSLGDLLSVGIQGDIGIYADLKGIYKKDFTATAESYAAARLEIGWFRQVRLTYALFRFFADEIDLIKYDEDKLLVLGYDRAYFAFGNIPQEITISGHYNLSEDEILKVKYYDIESGKTCDDVLNFHMSSCDVDLTITFGSEYCHIDGNRIVVATDAPNSFEAVLKITIEADMEWGKHYVGNSVYYLQDQFITIRYIAPENAGLSFTPIGDGRCVVQDLGTCNDSAVIIPSHSPDGELVVGIADDAFSDCDGIEFIQLCDSIESIGNSAFLNCYGLKTVHFSNQVNTIGRYAFAECYALSEIIFDGTMSEWDAIEKGQDWDANTGNYTLICTEEPETTYPVTETDPTPQTCGTPTITTANGVEIEQGNDLTLTWTAPSRPARGVRYYIAVMDAGHNYAYTEVTSNWITSTSYTIDAKYLLNVGTYVIRLYAKADGYEQSEAAINVYVKEKTPQQDTTASEGLAFTSNGDGTCAVSGIGIFTDNELVIPSVSPNGDRVTEIGKNAFYQCKNLTSIVVPDSIVLINEGAFFGCSNLQNIELPFVGKCMATESDTLQYPFGYIFGTNNYENGVPTTQWYRNSSTTTTMTIYYIPKTLTSVTIRGGSLLFGSFDCCEYISRLTIGKNMVFIGNHALTYCLSLRNITYLGTCSEWEAIDKGPTWDIWTPSFVIACTDGNIDGGDGLETGGGNFDSDIVTNLSFDELRINGTEEGLFTPGAEEFWDYNAEVGQNVDFLQYWGWIGIMGDIGTFGYQIDDGTIIYDESFTFEPEQAVLDTAINITGADTATRMRIDIDISNLSGKHTVKTYYKSPDNKVILLSEFILNRNASS